MTFASAEIGGPITAEDRALIESTARAEVVRAFAGLRITISARREARYRVRVTQSLRNPALRSHQEVAGASSALAGLGGHGAVSFTFLASGAVARAPAGADRAAKIEAIGRGIGRSAVHELVHQLLLHVRHPQRRHRELRVRVGVPRAAVLRPDALGSAWPLLAQQFSEKDQSP